jgi:UDP-glucose 6-dehydrogenase
MSEFKSLLKKPHHFDDLDLLTIYPGGPTAAVIAFKNPQICVMVVDKDPSRIRKWMSKHPPIHEPGLRDVLRVARDGKSTSQKTKLFRILQRKILFEYVGSAEFTWKRLLTSKLAKLTLES